MSRALSPSISRRYGLARVARVWNVSRASVYRFRSETRSDTIARRPGPVGACSDAELAEHIADRYRLRLHGEVTARYGRAALRRRSREPRACGGYGRARLARGASRRTARGQGA